MILYNIKMYYECKSCFHITKQKIEMIRHLNRKNKCIRKNIDSIKYSDSEIYELSIEKKYNDDDKINNNDKNDIKFICIYCNISFHNKSNLNRHLQNKKCMIINKNINIINNNTNNNTNNTNILNQQNNIININLSIVKPFEDEWDVSKIDQTLRNMLVLSNMKYTKTLEHILDNETNLNVMINDESDSGLVYTNNIEKFTPMSITDIIDKSMDKLHKQLSIFYNDLKNTNEYMLDDNVLEQVKDATDKKYEDFKKNKTINLKVKEFITNIYNNKRNETLKIYDLLCNNDDKDLINGY
jgi:hypothetical protein